VAAGRVLVVASADTSADVLARVVTAGRQLGAPLDVLVLSEAAQEVASKVLVQHARGYGAVLAAADDFGRDALARAAALADVLLIGEVIAIPSARTVVRPVFADSAHATLALPSPAFLTVRPAAFAPAASVSAPERIAVPPPDPRVRRMPKVAGPRGASLAGAKVVVGVGRGAATPARMAIVRRIAERLGAAIGATRPAVDEGVAPEDALLGQSGKVVAPRLYIALGVSGALQHLAGVKDAAVIAAINTDAEAPMCAAADLCWVADLDTALPELEAALNAVAR
jgi:electron transfer flavoprotein alpha subunit